MLRPVTIEDIKNKRVTRRHGRIVVVTRFYPRYLQKKLLDEYHAALAPSRDLLREYRETEARVGDHNRAFDEMDYERKFRLGPAAFAELERLALLSQTETVYLGCHCAIGQRCHRELLMLLARELYQAPISKLYFAWEIFRARFEAGALAEITAFSDEKGGEAGEEG